MYARRHVALSTAISLLILIATLLCDNGLAQRSPKRRQWEYCAITKSDAPLLLEEAKIVGAATICFFQNTGCKTEVINFDVDVTEFRKSLDQRATTNEIYVRSAARLKAIEGALASAITKLGAEGWEMVGESLFRFGSERNDVAIYFKREK